MDSAAYSVTRSRYGITLTSIDLVVLVYPEITFLVWNLIH